MNKRHFFRNALAVAAVATLSLVAQAQDKVIKIGVTAGPHAQIFEQVLLSARTGDWNDVRSLG